MHFVKTRSYERIMPPYIPRHRELVYVSGVAEIAGGLATMHPRTRRAGSAWSIATLIAVFPANLHMAIEWERYEKGIPEAGSPAAGAAALHRLGYAAGDWDYPALGLSQVRQLKQLAASTPGSRADRPTSAGT